MGDDGLDKAARIIVVDDDPDVRAIVARCLEDGGFEVVTRGLAAGIEPLLEEEHFDIAIIDLMLPDADGLSLTRSLSQHPGLGVIILSGRGETTERIVGLEVGADDYVAKPFEPRELLARVRSVHRRLQQSCAPCAPTSSGSSYRFEGWKLDVDMRRLENSEGTETPLTSGEFAMLKAFVENSNRVLSRDRLIELTSEHDSPAFDRSIDVRVGRLRKKIEPDPRTPIFIKTVRNLGYMFTARVERL